MSRKTRKEEELTINSSENFDESTIEGEIIEIVNPLLNKHTEVVLNEPAIITSKLTKHSTDFITNTFLVNTFLESNINISILIGGYKSFVIDEIKEKSINIYLYTCKLNGKKLEITINVISDSKFIISGYSLSN